MSSNMNPSTPTNDSTKVAANAPPAARLKWDDLDGIRTLLFVLYKRYAYWNASVYAQIVNAICIKRMTDMGLPQGIDNHRIGAEWRGRKKAPASEKWKVVRSKGNEAEMRHRDRWENIIRLVAKQLKLELREEVGEDQDGDGSDIEDESENEVAEMTDEEDQQEAKEFREKFNKLQGN